MPGVHYKAVQSRVPMARVLELLGFVACGVTGDQLRGPCPVHCSQSLRSRSFSVHLARDVCRCFKCGFAGNQIQLWAALNKMTVYEAAVDLCQQAGVEVPWIKRWQTCEGAASSLAYGNNKERIYSNNKRN
jgi:DNA primase